MKMTKHVHVFALLALVSCTLCNGQNKAGLSTDIVKSEFQAVATSHGPNRITRNIIQDRKGDIWIAAFDGIFRYDGKSFTNITGSVSSARFFSVLEDQKGDLWFGTIGSGVYHYDGKSFRHFTTSQGLADDRVPHIYKDKAGDIWFGTLSGASRYDGKVFRNYKMSEGFPGNNNDVNAIMEDKTRKFWFGTRGDACVYDGKTFTVLTHNGQTFTNVRTIIEDRKGNIWLGGQDGLWRYDGHTFTYITEDFVGYICEDRKGNIWTSAQSAYTGRWGIFRYDEKSLSDKKPAATEIESDYKANREMVFGILEANDGSIWFGSLDGVYRYDGNTIKDFKGKDGQK
jgi:ligand-binding sensor domain-containing protein